MAPKKQEAEAPPKAKGSALSPLKLIAGVRMFLLARTGRKSIGALAGFQTICSLLQLIYWVIMPSTTDIAGEWMNRSWIHMVFIIPSLMGGLLGIIVCMTCNVRLCRLYFFWLPIAFLCPMPCTTTFWHMKCDCSNYYQCSALKSFADYKGFKYVNPHPIPDDSDKFGEPLVPWAPPPGAAAESSLVQKSWLSNIRYLLKPGLLRTGDISHQHSANQTGSFLETSKPMKGVAIQGRHSDARKAQQPAHKDSLATDRAFLQQQAGATGETQMQDLVGSLRNAAEATLASAAGEGRLKSTMTFLDDASPSVDYDPRKLYKTRNPLEVIHKVDPGTSADGGEGQNKEICQSQEMHKDDDFWKRAFECRSPGTKVENSTRCDPKIDAALLSCAKNAVCGALQLIFRQGSGDTWNFTVCALEVPTYIAGFVVANSGEVQNLRADANCQFSDECVLFWERDMTQTLDERATSKVNAIMLEKQKKMPRDAWRKYIKKQQGDECTCEAVGNEAEDRSCVAYTATPLTSEDSMASVQYWCPVTERDKKICEAEHGIKDFKKDGAKYWSEKICQAAGCKCSVGIGLRIWDTAKNNVRKAHLQAASSEGQDPLIGHKCDYWYKDDELPWCVVGFDSTCGDRQAHTIPDTGVKIYTSRIPCTKHMTQNVADKAGQTCRIMQMAMLTLDSLRYICALPMFYMVLAFLMTRCGDQDTLTDTGGAGRAFDVSQSEGGDLDFFSDDEDGDLDFSDEGGSEESEPPPPKKKKK